MDGSRDNETHQTQLQRVKFEGAELQVARRGDRVISYLDTSAKFSLIIVVGAFYCYCNLLAKKKY
jgi:hypothetical protein